MQIVHDFFKGLSNTGSISNQSKSGTISHRKGLQASIVHVAGVWYSWQEKPTYYACRFFYANCSFLECTGGKLMELYNKKNKDKIHRFESLEDLIQFIQK